MKVVKHHADKLIIMSFQAENNLILWPSRLPGNPITCKCTKAGSRAPSMTVRDAWSFGFWIEPRFALVPSATYQNKKISDLSNEQNIVLNYSIVFDMIKKSTD